MYVSLYAMPTWYQEAFEYLCRKEFEWRTQDQTKEVVKDHFEAFDRQYFEKLKKRSFGE